MPLTIALWSVAVLLIIAFAATAICRLRVASTVIYAICLMVSLANLITVGLQLVSDSAAASFGEANVIKAPGWTAADDFGFYSEKRPSVYFRLGIRSEEAGSVYPLHHPKFRVDEAALPVGAVTLAATAKRFLSGDSQE